MQRVIAPLVQKAVSLHHPGHIAGLDGDDDVVKIIFFQQGDVVHGAFHQRLGHRRAVFGQHLFFQAAGIHTDADGDILRLAGGGHFLHMVVAADVAGVQANFVHPRVHTGQSDAVVEVDVRHEGDVHGVLDGFDEANVLQGGHAHPHDLAARLGHPHRLGHVAGHVAGGHVEHGLHRHRVVPADGEAADGHFTLDLAHVFPSFLKFKTAV